MALTEASIIGLELKVTKENGEQREVEMFTPVASREMKFRPEGYEEIECESCHHTDELYHDGDTLQITVHTTNGDVQLQGFNVPKANR
jgi:hypothetical protein